MECVKGGLEVEFISPILFDFSDSSSDEVGKTRICRSQDEAYDPIAKKCRHIILSIAGQEGDYELDNCHGNISACKTLNCSRFVLAPKEYLLNDNFTVTDLLSNKLYTNGEFKIMDDGRIELCAQYQVMEEKFNSAIRYITLLGLGISTGFLILHLVAFATNAVHRNLSGKNLASLCTALILAYGTFIIGQLLQVGGKKLLCFCFIRKEVLVFRSTDAPRLAQSLRSGRSCVTRIFRKSKSLLQYSYVRMYARL
jgi:hypothetical protein